MRVRVNVIPLLGVEISILTQLNDSSAAGIEGNSVMLIVGCWPGKSRFFPRPLVLAAAEQPKGRRESVFPHSLARLIKVRPA